MTITKPGWTILLTLSASLLVGSTGCAPAVAPAPATVSRIAVLPPSDATGAPLSPRAPADLGAAPTQSLGAILAAEARTQLARQGFEVVDPTLVETATGGRVPSSPEMAAEILRSAKLDAAILFMRVRRWEFPYPTFRTDEVIVALDAMLVDPTSGQVVWRVRRPAKPVPLHGVAIGGQADAVAAAEVMKEVFASLGQRSPS
jgi:hypothetical protein